MYMNKLKNRVKAEDLRLPVCKPGQKFTDPIYKVEDLLGNQCSLCLFGFTQGVFVFHTTITNSLFTIMNPAERIKQSEIDKIQHIDEILEACRGKTMHDL